MSLLDTLQDTKNRLSALLAFANQKTGTDDSNIGDAIKTLADGFGSGGGKAIIVNGSDKESITLDIGFEPRYLCGVDLHAIENSIFRNNSILPFFFIDTGTQLSISVVPYSTTGANIRYGAISTTYSEGMLTVDNTSYKVFGGDSQLVFLAI